ncbi:hypothetical protein LNP18_06135 [Leuconostoc citreum]|uniref:hypothetical protein n=1 Tax=Leuconostoc citreum TaxID=33964 RepID=UPI00200A24BD|nr:hypothetical protein [Leuconostoc citreum]MCK8605681.1 hypothetical protein [Leuconostoc citreum]
MATLEGMTGFITSITKAPEVVIIAFQETGKSSVVALTIDTMRYLKVFPAGDPEMGVELTAVIEKDGSNITVRSIYDPNGDFIAADDLEEWGDGFFDDNDGYPKHPGIVTEEMKASHARYAAEVDALYTDEDFEEMAAELEAERLEEKRLAAQQEHTGDTGGENV